MLNKEQLFYEVAQKVNKSPEQVKLVYESLTNGIRFYLTNVFISKTRILIPKIGSFYIKEYTAKNSKVENILKYQQIYARSKKRKRDNEKSLNESE